MSHTSHPVARLWKLGHSWRRIRSFPLPIGDSRCRKRRIDASCWKNPAFSTTSTSGRTWHRDELDGRGHQLRRTVGGEYGHNWAKRRIYLLLIQGIKFYSCLHFIYVWYHWVPYGILCTLLWPSNSGYYVLEAYLFFFLITSHSFYNILRWIWMCDSWVYCYTVLDTICRIVLWQT